MTSIERKLLKNLFNNTKALLALWAAKKTISFEFSYNTIHSISCKGLVILSGTQYSCELPTDTQGAAKLSSLWNVIVDIVWDLALSFISIQ